MSFDLLYCYIEFCNIHTSISCVFDLKLSVHLKILGVLLVKKYSFKEIYFVKTKKPNTLLF